LNGSTVTGQVETSISSNDVCTQVWQMRLGHRGEKFLQAPAKKGSLEGLLDFIHVSIWGPAKAASLRGHRYFISFIGSLSRHC